MPALSRLPGLTITDPLVLYRSLLATNKIVPDPGQHRLAIRLQALYESVKDYEAPVDYDHKFKVLGSQLRSKEHRLDRDATHGNAKASWLSQPSATDSTEVVKTVSRFEAARHLTTPRGLMLHGEVGTGKSMLVDLFAECLPTDRKRRWHFNTFLLEVFARLEQHRRAHGTGVSVGLDSDGSLTAIARDLVETSPILFLDEFQLPDKAASKIMTNLMMPFFELGGVLIATSNRMPDELDKAAGISYAQPPSRFGSLRWRLGLGGDPGATNRGMFATNSEFVDFLDLLKARCDVWEMEGKDDYRRRESVTTLNPGIHNTDRIEVDAVTTETKDDAAAFVLPKHYHVLTTANASSFAEEAVRGDLDSIHAGQWDTATLQVYGRQIKIAKTRAGLACCSFADLCEANLGPADYISLASMYHTIILTDVPILTWSAKNEARRFITLLDALYEARCKLLITAAAGPDELFFPERDEEHDDDSYAVHSEVFAEAHQDATAPFRPNVSSRHTDFDDSPVYAASADRGNAYYNARGMLAPDSLEDDPPNRISRASIHDHPTAQPASNMLNFAATGAFTGEDERFAYKRARSRLWEMCSVKWWARDGPDWHKPVPAAVRRWENGATSAATQHEGLLQKATDEVKDNKHDTEHLFRHGASPFRRSSEPPPTFSWTHAWGMMQWGRKAGAWGKGVEGLSDRKRP